MPVAYGRLRVIPRLAELLDRGLIYIHRYMVQSDLDAGNLMVVFETNVRDADGVFAMYPQAESLSPKVRAVVDHPAAALAVPLR